MNKSRAQANSIFEQLNRIFGGVLMLFFGLFFITGCSTLSVDERKEIDEMARQTIATLCEDDPALEEEIAESPGYLVIDKRVVKIPVFGGGRGKGVIVHSSTEEKTYIKATRIEFGGGWGARSYKILMVFTDPKRIEKVQGGSWMYELGAEATAGSASLEGSSGDVNPKSGYQVYTLTDVGASATYTLRAIRLKPYRQ